MKNVALIFAIALTTILAACTSTEKDSQTTEFAVREVASSSAGESPVRTNFIEEINDNGPVEERVPLLGAKARMEKIFKFARASSIEFFRELRVRKPILESKGGALGKKKIPNIYVIARNADVHEALNHNAVFSVRPYEFIMDATVGEYMLSNENHYTNAEKPKMRHVLSGNDLPRVRKIIAQLAKEAIEDGIDEKGELDVVASVTRAVPIGLNSEYFGFPGPSPEKMAQWSRHTQHAFFHNPFRDEKVFQASRDSGKEMMTYIRNDLIPSRKRELANGRPANDPVSRMIVASAKHAEHGLDPARLASNVAGLLVGSVETTNAAIVQSLEFLMRHQDLFEDAKRAARNGDDKRLDSLVWEALRFNPVNPWVARYVEADYVIAKGTERETKIPKGSLALISTESAMFDPEVFPQPDRFMVGRPQQNYFHLGYGYHRCLGDDVSLVMVPETIKQILLLPGVRIANPKKGIEQKGGPFPESFIVKVNVPKAPKQNLIEKFDDKMKETSAKLGLGDFIFDRLMQMERRSEAFDAIGKIFTGKGQVREQAIDKIPGLVNNAMKNHSKDQIVKACMETNPLSVSTFPNVAERKAYCEVRLDFRSCYLLQRRFRKQSSQHSYNHCAYAKNLLTPYEREDFKAKLKGHPFFTFLSFE